jgi:hypothetical protein
MNRDGISPSKGKRLPMVGNCENHGNIESLIHFPHCGLRSSGRLSSGVTSGPATVLRGFGTPPVIFGSRTIDEGPCFRPLGDETEHMDLCPESNGNIKCRILDASLPLTHWHSFKANPICPLLR